MEVAANQLDLVDNPLIGAACTLSDPDLRKRLLEWREVRDQALRIERLPGGAQLTFGGDASVAKLADLVARESTCCAFYAFTLRVSGATRELAITAGDGGEPAVLALLGLPAQDRK